MMLLENYDRNHPPRIYVHIPFCRRKCAYCSFYSIPSGLAGERVRVGYFKRLASESALIREYFNGDFPSIYIGGGTPNLPENIGYVSEILQILGNSAEISMESNVSFVTEGMLDMLRGRITRLSVGVQSFSRRDRIRIGRYDDTDLLYGVLLPARKCGVVSALNLDFITNFDKRERFVPLFSKFAEHCGNSGFELPEHISLYSLQVEQGTAYSRLVGEGLRAVPDDAAQARQLKREWEYLAGMGYEHYEVSAFARSGNYCRHNLGYWTGDGFLGIGSHASSRCYFSDGTGLEIKCGISAAEYAASNVFSGYETGHLGRTDIAVELVLAGLRTKFGVSVSRLGELCDSDRLERLISFCRKSDGFVVSDGSIRIREDMMLFCEYYIRRVSDFLE